MLSSTGMFKEFFKYAKGKGGIAYVPLSDLVKDSENEDLHDAPVTYGVREFQYIFLSIQTLFISKEIEIDLIIISSIPYGWIGGKTCILRE